GGLDLTRKRWDTSDHCAEHPERLCDGVPYAPFHDVMMAVDGYAAEYLGELARERWRRATGKMLRPTRCLSSPWPAELSPDVVDVDVAISRTVAAYEGQDAVH